MLAVVDIAGNAGAGLFAAALAYGAMFALIPMVLLMAGVLGWLVDDPVQRQELLTKLIGYFPPLADFFSGVIERARRRERRAVRHRSRRPRLGRERVLRAASTRSCAASSWAAAFAASSIVAMRGIITIVGLIVLMIGTVLLSSVWAFVNDVVGEPRHLEHTLVPI